VPATPDPELAVDLAKEVVNLYSRAADEILADVARRLARGIDQPGWEERKLVEITDLRNAATARLEALRTQVPDAVTEAIERAYTAGGADAAADGVTAAIRTSPAAVRALVAETVTGLESTHFQILRSTTDVFRAAVAEVGAPSVVTGTRTRRQAAQQVLDRFANRGVTGFVDRAGRAWTAESYAEMAVRTSAGRAQVAGTLDRLQDGGRDLVIISDAPQECEKCRPAEGRTYSISGRSTKYPPLSSAIGAGLFHAGCRHTASLYIEGVTRRMTNTADPEGDQLRQEQRRLERGLRQWRRREVVALDDVAARKAKAKASEWRGRLDEHVKSNNLKRLRARETIGVAR